MARTKNTVSEKKIIDSVSKKLLHELNKKQSKIPQTFMVPVGFNTMMADANRRQSYGTTTTYQTLRQLSVQHETTRAAINLRKRQITQLDWDIVPVDAERNISDNERLTIKNYIKGIGGVGVRFRQLLDKLIEDTLVLDALCFYKQKTVGNKLLRIIPIDPSTIKLVVDQSGMRPMAPDFAYEQWIRGQKVSEMTTDELIYESMNPRTNSPYGFSPIEAMIVTLDASMRAMLYNLAYLSDNNIPNGFLNMPEEWTPEQIKEYKEYLDSVIASPKDQAKVFPIPSGSTYQATTKPSDFSFKDFFDYLDRRVCMVYDLAPQELGISLQQYKENAEGQEKIQMRKGLKPLANFVADVFTDIVQQDLGFPELQFKFNGLETKFRYEDAQKLIPLGVISIDEIRNDMGLKKLGVENLIMQGGQIMPVNQVNQLTVSGTQQSMQSNTQEQKQEVKEEKKPTEKEEMKMWETKALNDMKKKGKVYREFVSSSIPLDKCEDIKYGLAKAQNIQDIKDIFKGKKTNYLEKALQSDKAKKFKKDVIRALRAQVNPFTQYETIEAFTEFGKADYNDFFDEYLEEIDIFGLTNYYKWATEEGINSAKANLGIKGSFHMTSEAFADAISNRENYLIKSLDDTTKDWLVRQIRAGKEASMTNQEIADKIAEEYDDISNERADTIVNTEVANAAIIGKQGVFIDQGYKQKQWMTQPDEMVCEICGDNANKIVKMEDSFDGIENPPAHPNCRCDILPVLDEI